MSKNEMINSLCWIIIVSASRGYVSSNDLDFANDCLDKVQGNPTKRVPDGAIPCYVIPHVYNTEGVCLHCGSIRPTANAKVRRLFENERKS